MPDAVVVGAGPNGLAGAITLARAGLSVRVYEAASTPGGGCRTAELTGPGYLHDVCSTVQALAVVSPFFRTLDLESLGVRLRRPEVAYAHPLDGGRAGVLHADVDRTADGLDEIAPGDGKRWRQVVGPLARNADDLWPDVLGDLRSVPRHPVTLARFGVPGLLPASVLARSFRSDEGQGLIAGAAAHAMRALSAPLTSAFGLALITAAHASGWPVVEGGSGVLVDAMVTELTRLGGEIVCDHPVRSVPDAPVTLLDVTPRQFLAIAGDHLPSRFAKAMRDHRYGPGVFKIDYALSGPVPWTNPDARRAGTLHLGGTLGELARSEADVEAGRHPDAPYVLAVQGSVMDPTRAPAGHHTLWAYCHVPNGSNRDMTAGIERQVERFAPGFRDLVLHRSTRTAAGYHQYDENYVGGDINGGMATLLGTVLGPAPQWSRYATPLPGVYLCSSSTPPGGGVHGMSGHLAAREALRSVHARGRAEVRR
ncbi:phytoene desaturase family protein [Pseudonocardia endophytica]|uniref:Phytoene dehydrogenase-like protein n=1 Tax=Pseudonocardia endophytica TaxID=401976 RepID=A0A4R1I2F0_PSEEN|nr:NAD(P)/FAD-dependent oxidoreductase [Pseudonocardia endophytica]TCK26669.1 phytoene dehydrogenase-like protein [Pseudonocardia endophytica]